MHCFRIVCLPNLLVKLFHDPFLVILPSLQLVLDIMKYPLELPDILLELILPLLFVLELCLDSIDLILKVKLLLRLCLLMLPRTDECS